MGKAGISVNFTDATDAAKVTDAIAVASAAVASAVTWSLFTATVAVSVTVVGCLFIFLLHFLVLLLLIHKKNYGIVKDVGVVVILIYILRAWMSTWTEKVIYTALNQ